MSSKGESEGLVDAVDVVNDVLYVSIGGIFLFDDLDFSVSTVR